MISTAASTAGWMSASTSVAAGRSRTSAYAQRTTTEATSQGWAPVSRRPAEGALPGDRAARLDDGRVGHRVVAVRGDPRGAPAHRVERVGVRQAGHLQRPARRRLPRDRVVAELGAGGQGGQPAQPAWGVQLDGAGEVVERGVPLGVVVQPRQRAVVHRRHPGHERDESSQAGDVPLRRPYPGSGEVAEHRLRGVPPLQPVRGQRPVLLGPGEPARRHPASTPASGCPAASAATRRGARPASGRWPDARRCSALSRLSRPQSGDRRTVASSVRRIRRPSSTSSMVTSTAATTSASTASMSMVRTPSVSAQTPSRTAATQSRPISQADSRQRASRAASRTSAIQRSSDSSLPSVCTGSALSSRRSDSRRSRRASRYAPCSRRRGEPAEERHDREEGAQRAERRGVGGHLISLAARRHPARGLPGSDPARCRTRGLGSPRGSRALPEIPSGHLRRGGRSGARDRAAHAGAVERPDQPCLSLLRAPRLRQDLQRADPGPLAQLRDPGPTPDPCGKCDSCVALAPDGPGSLDVIEIDAASHGGVDDARDLRERAFFAPVSSRYKVYIVDEAHMVSTQGFNALLKLVEEPPEFLVFVFATTEPDKVLATIRSRTHHYPFRLIPPGALRGLLSSICTAEGIAYEPTVLPAGGAGRRRLGAGRAVGARPADRRAGPDGVKYATAVGLLGVTDGALLDEIDRRAGRRRRGGGVRDGGPGGRGRARSAPLRGRPAGAAAGPGGAGRGAGRDRQGAAGLPARPGRADDRPGGPAGRRRRCPGWPTSCTPG